MRKCEQCGTTANFRHGRRFCSKRCYGDSKIGQRTPLIDRFWAKVTKSEDPDGCWLWTAATDTKGYGQIGAWIGDKIVLELASHVSYRLYIGPLERGEWILHTCDTPACVAPHHIYKGNAALNARDREARGRGRYSKLAHRVA